MSVATRLWRTGACGVALSLASCGGGSPASPAAPSGGIPTPTPTPAAQTTVLACVPFSGLQQNDGLMVDFKIPGTGTPGSGTTVGVLRIVSDWDEAATDLDILYSFWGCPSLRAILNGGCRVYGSDQSLSKPAQYVTNVASHDLTVDPGNPGARIAFLSNKGPRPASGVLQVTFTVGGQAPTGPPTCASTPSPTPTPTPGATPTPRPAPTPTPQQRCGATSARVTDLNLEAERVTVSGSGSMRGWSIRSRTGGQRYDFPPDFVLSGSVRVQSGPNSCSPSSSVLCWTTAYVWNNNGDAASLYDCDGALVNTVSR